MKSVILCNLNVVRAIVPYQCHITVHSNWHWVVSLEYHELVPIAAVNPLLVPRHLHRPLEALAADVAAMSLDREVRAADVVAQRCGVFELHVADVTDAWLAAVRQRLLDGRVQHILDHSAVAGVLAGPTRSTANSSSLAQQKWLKY